ncbi:glycosyltransferase family 4 protein [Brevibacillus sp. B_LB10_24]|uniref:glycosyltransferase family 4 protein n=1 Tax=Brevibacillus sp. B_LB10_24 TaxID=3380645 RepID=UPI0038B9C161
MRIWVLTNEYAPFIIGGLGTVATYLSQSLAAGGVDTTVFTRGGQETRIVRGQSVRHVRIPRKSYKGDFLWGLARRKGWKKPHLIHIHSVQGSEAALHCKKRWGLPVVYTCHSLVVQESLTPRRRQIAKRQEALLRAADCVVVPSHWQKESLHKFYPFCQGKTVVIENGVHIRKKPGSSPNHRLLFVGRFTYSKGIAELIEALAALARVNPKTQLGVVGKGIGKIEGKLKQKAARLKVAAKIRWLGFRRPEEVQRLYGRYGAVIVPSRRESFGLVALEALANGVPLVSTTSGGLAQFVNSEVAEVIPAVNKEAIAKAVQNMWAEKERTNERVQAGLSAAASYSWKAIAARYRSLFESITAGEEEAIDV